MQNKYSIFGEKKSICFPKKKRYRVFNKCILTAIGQKNNSSTELQCCWLLYRPMADNGVPKTTHISPALIFHHNNGPLSQEVHISKALILKTLFHPNSKKNLISKTFHLQKLSHLCHVPKTALNFPTLLSQLVYNPPMQFYSTWPWRAPPPDLPDLIHCVLSTDGASQKTTALNLTSRTSTFVCLLPFPLSDHTYFLM